MSAFSPALRAFSPALRALSPALRAFSPALRAFSPALRATRYVANRCENSRASHDRCEWWRAPV